MRETAAMMTTITLSLLSLLHLLPTRHRLVSQQFFKWGTYDFWINDLEPSIQIDRAYVNTNLMYISI
jgi:hypothetical protein